MSNGSGWTLRTVADCLVPTSFRSSRQIQTREYKTEGRYPIIDQGQAVIAGWTDDESAVIESPLPVVIFGDHSRTLKFIDEPFARGADGTQVLVPINELDPKFFYFACKHINVPARGYNRHFGQLKESTFRLPTDRILQGQIATALSAVEDAVARAAEQIKLATALKFSATNALFSCGTKGEMQKMTEIGLVPESWACTAFSELGRVVTGSTPATKHIEFYENGVHPFVSPGDIEHGLPTKSVEKTLSDAGLAASRRLPAGTTLVVCIGSTIGKVGRTTAEWSTCNQQINAIIPADGVHKSFLTHLMTWSAPTVRGASSPSPVPILSKGPFEKLQTYMPTDPNEQARIAEVLDAIDIAIGIHSRKHEVLLGLFSALLHKLMTGEIDVNDLDLSALQPTT